MATPRLPDLTKAVRGYLRDLGRLESSASVVDRATLDQAAGAAADKLEAILAQYATDGTIDIAALSTISKQAGDLAAEAISRATTTPGAFATHLAGAADLGLSLATELGAFPNLTTVDLDAGRRLAAAMTAKGSPLAELLDGLGDSTGLIVRDRLSIAMLLGENPRTAARRIIGDGADIARSRADTIARTELLRASRSATLERYQNSDAVDGWVWLSAADGDTCPACWAMHGSRHDNDEELDGHPNCRCTMVPLVADGIAQDIPEGDVELAQLPDDEQAAILGPSRFDQWRDGRANLSDFVDRRSSPKWGTMRVLAPFDAKLDRRAELGPLRSDLKAARRTVAERELAVRASELNVPLEDYRAALDQAPALRETLRDAGRQAYADALDHFAALDIPDLPRPPAGKWESASTLAPGTPGIRRGGIRGTAEQVYVRRYADGTAARGEWDWLDALGADQRKSLGRWFTDANTENIGGRRNPVYKVTRRGLGGTGAANFREDLLTALNRAHILTDDTNLDAGTEWLTGRLGNLDALEKFAKRGALSGNLDTDTLRQYLPHRIDPAAIIHAGADDHELARLLLEEYATEASSAAEQALADTYRYAELGPMPWTMTANSYAEEVLELEYRAEAGAATLEDRHRLDALLPRDVDDRELALEEVHALIVDLARAAGESVPSHILADYG